MAFDLTNACSAYQDKDMLCSNGFVQRSACRGTKCHACGRWSADDPANMPHCLKDELPEHFVTMEYHARMRKRGMRNTAKEDQA